jgi:hypothetical protein
MIEFFDCSFFACPKNEPKKAARSHWSCVGCRTPLTLQKLTGAAKLVCFQQTQTVLALFPSIFEMFGKVMMGLKIKLYSFKTPFCPAEHRRSWRDKTLELFERSEFFNVPPNARSTREPEGPGQRGALFLLLLLGTQKKEVEKSLFTIIINLVDNLYLQIDSRMLFHY